MPVIGISFDLPGQKRRVKSLLLIFFVLTISLCAQAEDKMIIRASIPAGLAPPLLIEKGDKKEGLIVDYTNALAEILGRKAQFSVVTRYRLLGYLLKGQMDILCYTSPLWDSSQDKMDFSKTLFIKREIVIGQAPMPKTVEGLKGKTLGTMLQYVYPTLDPYFSTGKINREDNVSEEANLKKLLHGRIQYVVTDQIFLDYFRLKNPDITKNRQTIFLKDYPIICSTSRLGRVTKKDLDNAITKLKSSGKLELLFKKYGSTMINGE
ncbi:substrate-binding periplasmic protein [Bdellovibrio bacteriovorus]|nr:transporter substrate-binding domain-containing protein [Bdellovibrio bacteriovorus]